MGQYDIEVDTSTHYGDFTGDDGSEGELWFQGRILSDYDGVRYLPDDVIQGLRQLDCIVSDTFE